MDAFARRPTSLAEEPPSWSSPGGREGRTRGAEQPMALSLEIDGAVLVRRRVEGEHASRSGRIDSGRAGVAGPAGAGLGVRRGGRRPVASPAGRDRGGQGASGSRLRSRCGSRPRSRCGSRRSRATPGLLPVAGPGAISGGGIEERGDVDPAVLVQGGIHGRSGVSRMATAARDSFFDVREVPAGVRGNGVARSTRAGPSPAGGTSASRGASAAGFVALVVIVFAATVVAPRIASAFRLELIGRGDRGSRILASAAELQRTQRSRENECTSNRDH
jgi:hypothetical protein